MTGRLLRRRLLQDVATAAGLGIAGTAGLLPRAARALPATPSCPPPDGGSTGDPGGDLSGSSSPPPPATGVNTALPFGGQYLGCPIYAASKAPNGYWDKHAYRFVAEHSGAVKTVRWENRTGSGYSVGNGGSIQLSIQTDSGGVPLGPEARLHRRPSQRRRASAPSRS